MTHDDKLREILERYHEGRLSKRYVLTQAIADINALWKPVDVNGALNILDRNVVNCVIARADVSMRGDNRLIFSDRLPLTEKERIELWDALATVPLYSRGEDR